MHAVRWGDKCPGGAVRHRRLDKNCPAFARAPGDAAQNGQAVSGKVVQSPKSDGKQAAVDVRGRGEAVRAPPALRQPMEGYI